MMSSAADALFLEYQYQKLETRGKLLHGEHEKVFGDKIIEIGSGDDTEYELVKSSKQVAYESYQASVASFHLD